jgi:hypothetical protein
MTAITNGGFFIVFLALNEVGVRCPAECRMLLEARSRSVVSLKYAGFDCGREATALLSPLRAE